MVKRMRQRTRRVKVAGAQNATNNQRIVQRNARGQSYAQVKCAMDDEAMSRYIINGD